MTLRRTTHLLLNDNVSKESIMGISTREQGDAIIINLSNTFNFMEQAEFRKSYEGQKNSQARKYILDFRLVQFIDSSSLGMILLLNDHVSDTVRNKITLRNTSQNVQDIFKEANFHKIFHYCHTRNLSALDRNLTGHI